ncbi:MULTISPECIES: DUF1266 domain-containing protein [Aquimarina]|uniref:DUF1266 domain-containing protein n=1 Tax=Aquimarina algiphila TaxID=2047982 RepID=A0A554VHM0_9FLAO|nr:MULTISPECIES: DUF1266 domain-containing protein [Aquimarina]TSE07006.1 DUF1266 domain-containing protein [Aquimarina algiphila]
MKLVKKTTQVLAAMFMLVMVSSCNSTAEKIEDEQLSSFMLGGIYFFNGYGGIDEVKEMMSSAGYTSNEELVSGYKEILEFPFESSQASGIKSMFRNMWEITNKATLLETLEDLKTREYKYKSWDYARIVNNACMGYAANYLTKDEVLEIIKEILPLAREKYKNWEAYFTDFNLGRVDWNPKDEEGEAFEFLSKNITKGEQSIYMILPLNSDKE